MYSDEKYREYLLGLPDQELEAGIEEAILDGRVDLEHLHQEEEELIDDFLFNRLSATEVRMMQSNFLSIRGRAGKLEFSRALQQYAAQHTREPTRRTVSARLSELATNRWIFPLAGALTCFILTAFWLAERNVALGHELAQAAQADDEHLRIIASMQKDQQVILNRPATPTQPTELPLSTIPVGDQPDIQLSAGVSRGLTVVPVLHLKKQATTASIVLELPFTPTTTLREELLSSDNKQIWSQQFFNVGSILNHGLSTIVLPAGLLATGEYRLRAQTDASGDGTGPKATYLFRVRKD